MKFLKNISTQFKRSILIGSLGLFSVVLSVSQSCGADKTIEDNENTDLKAIQSSNSFNDLYDRVYLALDDAEIYGQKTKMYYIVGCYNEGSITDTVDVYHPLKGTKSMLLSNRKWLYEFNPRHDIKDPKNGDCEILFGAPHVQKFSIEKQAELPGFLTNGLAFFTCSSAFMAVRNTFNKTKNLNFSELLTNLNLEYGINKIPKNIKNLWKKSEGYKLSTIAVIGFGFICVRYAYSYVKHEQKTRHDKNAERFASMFDHAISQARKKLQHGSDIDSKKFQESVEESNTTGSRQKLVEAAGYLAEKTVELFNGDLSLWSKATDESIQDGSFHQGAAIDIIRGKYQFFETIKNLNKVKWDNAEASVLYSIPDDYKGTVTVKCNSLRVREHHLTNERNGAPIYSDKDFRIPLGILPIGAALYRRAKKTRTHSNETPAIHVRILDDELSNKLGIRLNESVWIHPIFVEFANDLPCDPFINQY